MTFSSSIDALEVFSTCPQSKDVAQEDYVRRIVEVARCFTGWTVEAPQ